MNNMFCIIFIRNEMNINYINGNCYNYLGVIGGLILEVVVYVN